MALPRVELGERIGSSFDVLEVQRAPRTILSNATTTAVGTAEEVRGFKNLVYAIHTVGGSATTTFYGSTSETAPTVTNSSTASNSYIPLSFVNLSTGSTIAGTTGVASTGTSTTYIQLNTDLIGWVIPRVTAISGSSVTIERIVGDNQ